MLETLRAIVGIAVRLLYALFLLGVVAGLFVALWMGWKTASLTRGWPSVEAIVLESTLVPAGKKAEARIRYRYEVDARVYTSSNVSPDGDRMDFDDAHELVAEHPAGGRVLALRDPRNPARAYLKDATFAWKRGAVGILAALFVLLWHGWTSLVPAFDLRRRFVFPKANVAIRRPPWWMRRRESGANRPDVTFRSGGRALSLTTNQSTSDVLNSAATVATNRVDIVSQNYVDARVVSRERAKVGALDGMFVEIHGKEKGRKQAFHVFAIARRGFSAELLLYGAQRKLEGAKGRTLLQSFAEGFEILDPDLSSYAGLPPLAEGFRSALTALRFEPRALDLRTYSERPDDAPLEFGALHAAGGIVSAGAFLLPEGTPFDAAAAGLLALYGIDAKEARLVAQRQDGDARIRDLAFTRDSGENRYALRIRVLARGRVAALLVVCAEPDNAHLERMFEEAAACLAIDGVETALPPATALEPSDWTRYATVYEAGARWLTERNACDPAVAMLEWLLADPRAEGSVLGNLLRAHIRTRRTQRALDAFVQHAGRFPDDLGLQSWEPFLQFELGRMAEARDGYARLFAAGWQDAEDRSRYVRALVALGEHATAIATLNDWIAREPALRLYESLCWVQREAGDVDGSVASAHACVEAFPDGSPSRVNLARTLIHAGRHADALEVLAALEERGFASAAVSFERGVAECGLRRFKEAQRSFQQALDRDPGNEEYRRWLEHATAELGQGSNRLIRHPIEPLDLPASDPAHDDGFDAWSEAGASAVCLEWTRVLRFVPGEDQRLTTFVRIRVNDAREVERFGTFPIRFDPESEQLFVNDLRVRDLDGELIAVGRLDDWFVKDADRTSAESAKVACLPALGLRPKTILEVTYTKRPHGHPETVRWPRFELGGNEPVWHAAVEVRGRVDLLQHQTRNGVVEQHDERRLRFEARRVAGVEREPCAVDDDAWRPLVHVAAQEAATWTEVANRYLERIEDRLGASPAVTECAERITRGLADPRAKAAAIAQHVRREVAYQAVSFGPRGIVPDEAARVLETRLSDCKGHSMLFLQLMRAAGLRCELALVHTKHAFWRDGRGLWQFDHMINWCPDLDGGRFVDCTDKGSSIDAAPYALAGRSALVLEAQDPRIAEIPPLGPDDNLLQITRTVRHGGDGLLRVDERLTLRGVYAATMRRWCANTSASRRGERFCELLQPHDARVHFDGGVEAFGVMGMDELQEDVVVTVLYEVQLDPIDGRLVGRLPAPIERLYVMAEPLAARRSPFEVDLPFRISSSITVEGAMPAGSEGRDGVENRSGDDVYARWTSTRTLGNGGFTLAFEATLPAGRHPPDAWAAYARSRRRACDALSPPIRAHIQASPPNFE